MRNTAIIIACAAAAMLTACGPAATLPQTTRAEQYALMYEEKPVTLLIMPPINNTANVKAKEYLYTSISRPLAEAGYYVISPMLAMDILKEESAYDAELFTEGSLNAFKEHFGADAVVFSEINSWTKSGFGIRTDIRYFIRSAHTGETLFDRSCNLYLDLSVDSGSNSALAALLELAASAINTAATEHITAARNANYYIFRDIPRGIYSPYYQTDGNLTAEPKDVSATVK